MGNPKEGDIILDNTTKNSSSKVDEINVANTLSKELTDNFDFMENKSIEDIQNFFNKHKNDIRFAKYLNNFDFNVE